MNRKGVTDDRSDEDGHPGFYRLPDFLNQLPP